MGLCPTFHNTYVRAFSTLYYLNLDFIRFLGSLLQSRSALAAENLFLRKQLALYQERQVQPRRGHRCHLSNDGIGGKTV